MYKKICTKAKLTKKEVISASKHFGKKRYQHRKECRYYHCPNCNMWHLTSKMEAFKPKEFQTSFTLDWKNLLNNQL